VAAAFAAAGPARGFEVYHSPTPGPNPGAPAQVPTGGSAVLELYIDNGPATSGGAVCQTGTGDEVCAFDIELSATGGVTLSSFTPEAGVFHTLTSSTLRANGGDVVGGDSGPTRIGSLHVASTAGGTIELVGRNFVDASVALQSVPSGAVVAVTGAGPGDLDGDTLLNGADNCPTIRNGPAEAGDPQLGNQTDADGDGRGDACDNCVNQPNPAVSPLGFQTTTGGQLDDDADGFGNRCDADFDNAGPIVNSTDFSLFKLAFGHPRNNLVCGSSGTTACDVFDLNGVGPAIDSSDFALFKPLFGQKRGPKCPDCGPPFDPNLPCSGDACP
jgi:hypothetical protein